jgi:hypothetical protein
MPVPQYIALSPPGPGAVVLALASMVPAMVALPKTTKTTGLLPTRRRVLERVMVRFAKTRTSTLGPPLLALVTEG